MDERLFSRDFRYRGLTCAELDELIDVQKMHGYEGVIKELARLRQENARLQQLYANSEAQPIGQMIQAILNRGFFVNYTFDRRGDVMRAHHFGIWKYHGKEMIIGRVMIDDFELKHSRAACMLDVEHCMQQIDEQITQRRLIEEALP